jgi:hypothetical protein
MTLEIQHSARPPVDLLPAMWTMYQDTFAPLAELAAQRHLMTFREYSDLYVDDRILNYWAEDDTGAVVAQGATTRDLEALPLVSPDYFEHRWPGLYKQKLLFYVVFAAVDSGHAAAPGMYAHLIDHMHRPMRDARGIAVMDFCTYNVDTRRLPVATGAVLRRAGTHAPPQLIDRQEFWIYDFGPTETV